MTQTTFDDLFQAVLDDYEAKRNKSIRCIRLQISHLKPHFQDLDPNEVVKADIDAYIKRRRKEGAADGSICLELACLRRAYKLGFENRKITQAPKIVLPKVKNARKGFVSFEEYHKVRAALPPHYAPVYGVGFWTGMRIGEILSIRREQFDAEAGTLRLDAADSKSGEGRVIPLSPEALQDVIQAAHESACLNSPWLFTEQLKGAKKQRISYSTFSQHFRMACARAQVPNRLFHDLRRTAVRNMIRAGVTEKVAMQISGHLTRDMLDRYNICNEDDMRQAAAMLSAYVKSRQAESSDNNNGHQQNNNIEKSKSATTLSEPTSAPVLNQSVSTLFGLFLTLFGTGGK